MFKMRGLLWTAKLFVTRGLNHVSVVVVSDDLRYDLVGERVRIDAIHLFRTYRRTFVSGRDWLPQ